MGAIPRGQRGTSPKISSLSGVFRRVQASLRPAGQHGYPIIDPGRFSQMNAPLLHSTAKVDGACLRVFALFHLNLAFSSIEEERRPEVVARCYWPLLRLAENPPGIGLEV